VCQARRLPATVYLQHICSTAIAAMQCSASLTASKECQDEPHDGSCKLVLQQSALPFSLLHRVRISPLLQAWVGAVCLSRNVTRWQRLTLPPAPFAAANSPACRPSLLKTVSPAPAAGAAAAAAAPPAPAARLAGDQQDGPVPAAFWLLMRCSSSPTVALHAMYSAAADNPLLSHTEEPLPARQQQQSHWSGNPSTL
jgi:hypothetical protein